MYRENASELVSGDPRFQLSGHCGQILLGFMVEVASGWLEDLSQQSFPVEGLKSEGEKHRKPRQQADELTLDPGIRTASSGFYSQQATRAVLASLILQADIQNQADMFRDNSCSRKEGWLHVS